MAQGTVFALDIEAEMVEITAYKALEAGLNNVCAVQRDFIAEGAGLPDDVIDYVMLFTILRCEQPSILLREAWRILRHGGVLAIIHWNYDPTTPRGPSMDIRPRPEQRQAWAETSGFRAIADAPIKLPPYHYGMALQKT